MDETHCAYARATLVSGSLSIGQGVLHMQTFMLTRHAWRHPDASCFGTRRNVWWPATEPEASLDGGQRSSVCVMWCGAGTELAAAYM